MTGSGGITVNNAQNSNVNFTVKSGSVATAFQIDGSSGAATFGNNVSITGTLGATSTTHAGGATFNSTGTTQLWLRIGAFK